jgi:hypothetical protein
VVTRCRGKEIDKKNVSRQRYTTPETHGSATATRNEQSSLSFFFCSFAIGARACSMGGNPRKQSEPWPRWSPSERSDLQATVFVFFNEIWLGIDVELVDLYHCMLYRSDLGTT